MGYKKDLEGMRYPDPLDSQPWVNKAQRLTDRGEISIHNIHRAYLLMSVASLDKYQACGHQLHGSNAAEETTARAGVSGSYPEG